MKRVTLRRFNTSILKKFKKIFMNDIYQKQKRLIIIKDKKDELKRKLNQPVECLFDVLDK